MTDATGTSGPGVLEAAMGLVAYLRRECPWDRKQTPESLTKHLIEEAHEVVSAIVDGDGEQLSAELGDLLLNLAFQLVIAEEAGAFQREHVWQVLEQKMKRRHPHLFGLGAAESWDQIKAKEAGTGGSRLDGMAATLPPLARSYALQRRAASVGFDWDDAAGALVKVREETEEVASALSQGHSHSEGGSTGATYSDSSRESETSTATGVATGALAEELGDLLFAVVNLVRLAGADPSLALARANQKFERRFRKVEANAREHDLPMPGTPLEALDGLWDEVKRQERDQIPPQ